MICCRVLLLAAVVVACRPHERAGDVPNAGFTFPPLPQGVEEVGGMLLTDSAGQEFGVSQMQRNDEHMIWLSMLTHHDSAGVPNWQLLHAVAVPTLHAAESVVWSDCVLEGARDPSVVAVGTWSARDSLTEVRHAWRPNLATRQIDSVPADRVACWAAEDRF